MFVIEKNETIFQEFPEIVMGVTNREEDFRASVMGPAMKRLSKMLNVAQDRVKVLSQVHSAEVVVVDDLEMNTQDIEADALVTNLRGVVLGVKTADCIPVLLYDPVVHAIGVAHAGRKGAKLGVVENTVNMMVREYGVDVSRLRVYLGPSLGAEDHAVFSEEVNEKMKEMDGVVVRQNDRGVHDFANPEHKRSFQERTGMSDEELAQKQTVYVDMVEFVSQVLIEELGVSEKSVEVSKISTMRDTRVHSYRRDYPEHGLMLSFIGICS